jgi:LytS/YehU family sensor histidine kinase
MRKRWNGVGEREKLSAQRKVWRMQKSAVRTDQLTSFESLKAERTAGTEENKASLQREKIFQSEIKSLQDDMKLDSHRSDLREQINTLRREIEEEKDARCVRLKLTQSWRGFERDHWPV